MEHDIFVVTAFEIVAPYTLRIEFDDASEQVINFWQMLRGELYTPLCNLTVFNQVCLDEEEGTLVWPNGADFDPATLHDWDIVGEAMIKMAQSWSDTPQTPKSDTLRSNTSSYISRADSLQRGGAITHA